MTNQNDSGFSVAASPFNGIKLDIGIFLLVGIILLVVLENISISATIEWLVLAGYGLMTFLWVFIRARKILKKTLEEHGQK